MGMDVYGKAATDEVGEYFRRNVWGWRPLADYVVEVHPDLTAGCTYWQSNDGDGLGAAESLALAEALESDISSGTATAYLDQREAHLKNLPRQQCQFCNGTGVRSDAVGVSMKMPARPNPHTGGTGWCNGCDGVGDVADPESHYSLNLDDLKKFAAFCRASGGFEIH